jgi:acetolactate synthase regulatory subunit
MVACGSSSSYPGTADPSVRVPVEAPPLPATWPPYPHFSESSCWARPFQRGDVPTTLRVAPSFAPPPRRRTVTPRAVVHQLLKQFGDRRFIRSIRLAPAPPATGKRVRALYAGGHPPKDALAAQIITVNDGYAQAERPSPRLSLTNAILTWEAGLIGGALRDDLCAAGGPPLVIWSGGGSSGTSDRVFALEQRFPDPSPASFRRRVARVGRRYGFRVVSLRLLRARQLAPLLIVGTSRPRAAFAHDIPKIMDLLDPASVSDHRTADMFEGFFFGAEDSRGPFVEVQDLSRGESEGGQWSADPCDYPYPTYLPQKCPRRG